MVRAFLVTLLSFETHNTLVNVFIPVNLENIYILTAPAIPHVIGDLVGLINIPTSESVSIRVQGPAFVITMVIVRVWNVLTLYK